MPHIDLNNDRPGIAGLFQYRPETGRHLTGLAEVLLRGPHTLTRGERELIATYVSTLNQCRFCSMSHAAFAAAQLPEGMPLVDSVCAEVDSAPISEKLKALLRLAGLVRDDGRAVTAQDVAAARAAGASDLEIHDAVLIAAAFSMYNRYVDGLAAITPEDPEAYARMASRIVAEGYVRREPVSS